jgi:hypothetical protein
LLLTIGSGTLWTYRYSAGMVLSARCAVGACTGPAVLATAGFAVASWAGIRWSVWVAGAVLVIVSLCLWPVCAPRLRKDIAAGVAEVRRRKGPFLAGAVFYAVLALLLGLLFSHTVYSRPDGIYTGVLNNLGDLPFHLQIVSGFVQGHNFPPQDPAFAGVRFVYPFMADFLTAMLAQAGAPLFTAMWLQNLVLALALVGVVQYWTVRLTRERLAGFIAPVLLLLSGGLGWWVFFRDASASDTGILGLLPHLPRSYTIAGDSIFRWGNSLTTLFIPQRSILLGLPLAVTIFALWWSALDSYPSKPEPGFHPNAPKPGASGTPVPVPPREGSKGGQARVPQPERSEGEEIEETPLSSEDSGWGALSRSGPLAAMAAAGFFAGLLPLIHSHTFLVVMSMAACLFLLFGRWRLWATFGGVALVVALPELLWMAQGTGVRAQSFVGWLPGWERGTANPLWFWFVNTGLTIPLLLVAIFWHKQGKSLVSSKLLRFYLPFLLCFVVPNLVRLAPWGWDNIKVLIYWYAASLPLASLLLAAWWRTAPKWRWAVAGLLIALTLSGTLDLIRVLSGAEAYREFDSDEIAIGRLIVQRTAPNALVLDAPAYNPPVFLTGRRSLLGYPGIVWSRGIDYGEREQDVRRIYAGSPEAAALLRQYRVDYALVGPLERSNLAVNEAYWGQFPVVAQAGAYRLYRVETAAAPK